MARRALAALLCAAMIFSSESFSMAVSAAPMEGETVVEAVTEVTDRVEEVSESVTDDITVPEEVVIDDAVVEEIADANEVTVDETTDEAQPVEEQTEAEETEENVAEADVPVEEELIEQTEEELIVEQEVAEEGAPSSCFVVEEGTLKLVEAGFGNITSVVIPKEAKVIPANIFTNQRNITTITFEEGSLLETIAEDAFAGSAVTKLAIPAGVTKIPNNTFNGTRSLAEITFAGAVTEIGEGAFDNSGIKAINIPAVTTIKRNAFRSCTELVSVSADALTTIGNSAFQGCSKLTTGLKNGKIQTIGDQAFEGAGFEKLELDKMLSSEAVSIGVDVFKDCKALKEVTSIPGHLTVIPKSMFEGCSKLSDVTIKDDKAAPSVLETIDQSAFAGCAALERIILPKTTHRVESLAFDGCSGLKYVCFNYPNPVDGTTFIIRENAFPTLAKPSDLAMSGYDGLVQKYAEKKMYTYISLNQRYSVEVDETYCEITPSETAAFPGTKITFTVTPDEDETLVEGSVKVEGRTVSNPQVTLVGYTEKSQIYSFIMPEDHVKIRCVTVKKEKAVGSKLEFVLETVSGSNPVANDKGVYEMDKRGDEWQIRLKSKNEKGESMDVGPWLVNFSSSDTKVVSVTEKGLVVARGQGNATINITSKNDATKTASFKVSVKEDAIITSLVMDSVSLQGAFSSTEVIGDENVAVLTIEKEALVADLKTFDVSFKAYDNVTPTRPLTVVSEWSSADKTVAAVSKAESATNANTITLPKGAEGESLITITVKNASAKEESQKKITAKLIVRVIDATPRLADTKVKVNKVSSIGAAIDVVPVYGFDVLEGSLEIRKKTEKETGEGDNKKVLVDYNQKFEGLEVVWDGANNTYRLKATDALKLDSNASKTYSGADKLYLFGRYAKDGWSFVIPIPELTLENKELNPTIKLNGKINLFYNGNGSEVGQIELVQSLKDEKVKAIELVSEENYQRIKNNTTLINDLFKNNFTVMKDAEDENKFIITRTGLDLEPKDGKPVTTGYLSILYDGYKDPVYRKITIATQKTKPNLVLSMTGATANTNKQNQVYNLQILDKKTKKPIELNDVKELNLDFLASTPSGLFKDLKPADVLTDAEGKKTIIPLSVNGTPSAGKGVIYLKLGSWSEALRFNFALKVTSKHPAVILSAKTVTLNTICPSQSASVTLSLKQAKYQEDGILAGFDLSSMMYSGSANYQSDAFALMKNVSCTDDTITFALPAAGNISPYTYTFKVKPLIKYDPEAPASSYSELPYTTIKVVVSDKQPTVKMKTTTFTMNASYPGKEVVTTTYSLLNVPAGLVPTDIVGGTLVPANANAASAATILNGGNVVFHKDGTVSAVLLDKSFATAFSYDYYVSGMVIKYAGGETSTIPNFKIKIKGVKTNPTVSLSGKGNLNPIDPNSVVTYTAKIKGVSGTPTKVDLYEINPETYGMYKDEAGTPISKHFDVALGENNQVIIKTKPGTVLNGQYKYTLGVNLYINEIKLNTVQVTITPKQTLPKIKVEAEKAYLYAGQNRAKTVEVKIAKDEKEESAITFAAPVLSTTNSEQIKEAFRVKSFDPATGIVTIELKNPSAVVLNKTYSIELETRYVNQMEKTKGNVFKVNVEVRK